VKKPTAWLWSNLRNRWERFCGWERANREASRNRERRRAPRRDAEFEGRAWRTPGEQIMARSARSLADAASGKSHRSVTEEQEGEKKQSTGLWTASEHSASSTPLTSFFLLFAFFFRVLSFLFAETNRSDLVPVPSFPVIYDSKFSK
jgi:hypothetical protein